MVSLENLPYELLLRIAKNLQVEDLSEVKLVSKYFRFLTQDEGLWIHLSEREFPELNFSVIQIKRSKTMYHDLLLHKKLIGLWINEESGVMLIKMTEAGLLGQIIRLSCNAFGQYPYFHSTDKLKLAWDPKLGTFDRPIFSSGAGWAKCLLYFSSNHLLMREYSGSFCRSFVEKFDKVANFSTKLLGENILRPGLFVSSAGRSVCPVVLLNYTSDMEFMTVKKVLGNHSLGTESVKIAVSEVCDATAIFSFDNEDLDHPHRSSLISVFPSDERFVCREIPPRLDALSGGILKRLSLTYKAVYSCLIESSIDPGVADQSSGLCLILNDDVFTIYNSSFRRFRLYFRLESILNY